MKVGGLKTPFLGKRIQYAFGKALCGSWIAIILVALYGFYLQQTDDKMSVSGTGVGNFLSVF